jgi:hypothetical protein
MARAGGEKIEDGLTVTVFFEVFARKTDRFEAVVLCMTSIYAVPMYSTESMRIAKYIFR